MAYDPTLPQDAASIVERLKLKWLQRMEKLIDNETITAADMNTLCRLLAANGWVLDPTRMPKGLADKVGERIDPTSFDDGDADILPFNRSA
jgi:hypothetical protein